MELSTNKSMVLAWEQHLAPSKPKSWRKWKECWWTSLSKLERSIHGRYLDDTLLLVKPEDIDDILEQFNRFHNNIEFTVDRFDDCIPHFLDLEINHVGFSIYRKDTHTSQFMHFDNFIKWNHKVAWIRSLTSTAKRLCSHNKLSEEIKNIRRFASYNGFLQWTVSKIIMEVLSDQQQL